MGKWISVKNELPNDSLGRYIVTLENKMVCEMHFSNFHSPRWYSLVSGDESDTNKVTHWQNLPKPPRKLKTWNG